MIFYPTNLTQEELCSIFDYNPVTGEIKRKIAAKGARKNKPAGGAAGHKYIRISVNRIRVYAHRLAWFMVCGSIPEGMEIDHINGDGFDNRLCNLRLATKSENARNQKVHADNVTGLKWVYFDKRKGKYGARVSTDGSCIFAGYFNNPVDAHNAALSVAAQKHKEFLREE